VRNEFHYLDLRCYLLVPATQTVRSRSALGAPCDPFTCLRDPMPALNDQIDALTETVLSGRRDLDGALTGLERWLTDHAGELTVEDRRAFSATLDEDSTNDSRSLIDSVLKLHATRLLYQHDHAYTPPQAAGGDQSVYAQASGAFTQALRESEDGINETRIDIAIANAQHLLGNAAANRRWLDRALERLPRLAATDLVPLAQAIPPIPLKIPWLKRVGLKLIGFDFDRLARSNRESLAAIGRMQASQIVILAHLVGTSYEAIHERQLADRAFRVAAHLIVRYQGIYEQEVEPLLEIAESIRRAEPEAARILARQIGSLVEGSANPDARTRANAILGE